MKSHAAVMLLGWSLAACGGDGGGETCAPIGVYQVTYVRESGNCPDLEPALDTYDGRAAAVPDGCTSALPLPAAAACDIEMDVTCSFPENGRTLRMVGTIDFFDGGDRGSGRIQMDVRDAAGALLCSGTYLSTHVRQ